MVKVLLENPLHLLVAYSDAAAGVEFSRETPVKLKLRFAARDQAVRCIVDGVVRQFLEVIQARFQLGALGVRDRNEFNTAEFGVAVAALPGNFCIQVQCALRCVRAQRFLMTLPPTIKRKNAVAPAPGSTVERYLAQVGTTIQMVAMFKK